MLLITLFASCTAGKNLDYQYNQKLYYPAFSGRLIVITPKQRWQVQLDWRAASADKGWFRLVHAASNTVIELRWQNNQLWLRDQQQAIERSISMQELSKQGLVLHPAIIATFLLGQDDPNIIADKYKDNTWNIRIHGIDRRNIRLQWYKGQQKLIISDIKNGKQAYILIE